MVSGEATFKQRPISTLEIVFVFYRPFAFPLFVRCFLVSFAQFSFRVFFKKIFFKLK